MRGRGLRSGAPRRWRTERGSATVWALGVVALLGVVFIGVLAMGQAVVARHRAGSGADLAALAAAGEWMRGEGVACGRAEEVAGAQGVRVVGCVVRGDVADVSVVAGVGPYEVAVRARAGWEQGPSPVPPTSHLPLSP
ncbi:Rv3654c family TadE-like protein [Streptomyces sp. NPDC054863]